MFFKNSLFVKAAPRCPVGGVATVANEKNNMKIFIKGLYLLFDWLEAWKILVCPRELKYGLF